MKISIIGAGNIGQAIARHVVRTGYDVTISNSRGPETLSEVVNKLANKIKAVAASDAANADVVFMAVPWAYLSRAIASIPSWKGKILVDATNPILPGFKAADLGGKTSSEVVEEMAPGATVVKAFNTYDPHVLGADPHVEGGRRVIFFSGNDPAAKTTVAAIIDTLGFAGIDLGRLDEGGKLQQFPGGPLPALNLVKLG